MNNSKIPSYNQLKTLLRVIDGSKKRNEAHIHRKYHEFETSFPLVLRFLTSIGALKTESGLLHIKDVKFKATNTLKTDTILKDYLCYRILNTSDPWIKRELFFLKKFYFKDGVFKYIPSTKQRLLESGIRNLLIELEFITFMKSEKSYSILKKRENLFLKYIASKAVSLEKFQRDQKNKEKIGTSGELTIIAFEKDRLSLDLIYKEYEVKHVSQSNVSAGYDILSWDLEEKKQVVPRYIEVKVVSNQHVHFYFTSNELEKALLYGKRYYLYLLPLKNKDEFELSELKIIQDPYTHVFENPGKWDKQVDTYKFTDNTANEQ